MTKLQLFTLLLVSSLTSLPMGSGRILGTDNVEEKTRLFDSNGVVIVEEREEYGFGDVPMPWNNESSKKGSSKAATKGSKKDSKKGSKKGSGSSKGSTTKKTKKEKLESKTPKLAQGDISDPRSVNKASATDADSPTLGSSAARLSTQFVMFIMGFVALAP